MGRFKGYLAYLLIPAIPYLLMIFYPETIDPFYQYMAHGNSKKYAWCALLIIFLACIYPGIITDAQASNTKKHLIGLTKWYVATVGLVTTIYILLFDTATLKFAFLGMAIAVSVFYIYITTYGKNNA